MSELQRRADVARRGDARIARLEEVVHAYTALVVGDTSHLKTEPFPAPPKGKKLRGLNGVFWRLRVGAYRMRYRPIEPKTLFILRVIPRRELDRALRSL